MKNTFEIWVHLFRKRTTIYSLCFSYLYHLIDHHYLRCWWLWHLDRGDLAQVVPGWGVAVLTQLAWLPTELFPLTYSLLHPSFLIAASALLNCFWRRPTDAEV